MMDKKEAYELARKIFEICEPEDDCFGCPLEDKFDGSNRGGHCLINGLLDDACCHQYEKYEKVKYMGEEIKQPSDPLENVGSIIISGRPKESPEEKLDKALARAGSTIAQGMMADIAKHDNVNSPKHYCKGGLECIEVIKAQLTHEQRIGYLYGNIIKYMWRWPEKNGLEDLRKAEHYLKWLMEEVNHEQGLDRK